MTEYVRLLTLIGALGVMVAGCKPPKPVTVLDRDRARIDARSVLLQAADDRRATTRVYAIEAIEQVLPEAAGPIVRQGLEDSEPLVRSAAAMAAGRLQLTAAKPRLREMAMFKRRGAEREIRAYCSVLGALHRMGYTRHSKDFRMWLFHQAPEVRGQAAAGLGLTGDPAAIDMLKNRLEVEQKPLVRIQIVEALAALGDRAGMEQLEAYVHFRTDDGLAAISAIGRLRTPHAADLARLIINKSDQSPLRLAAAYGTMARTGAATGEAYRYCLRAATAPKTVLEEAFLPHNLAIEPDNVPSLQRLAALGLGWMDRPQAVETLKPLLKNTDGGVRVAAAMSILRLLGTDVGPAAPPKPEAPANVTPVKPVDPKDVPADAPVRVRPRRPVIRTAPAKEESGPVEAPARDKPAGSVIRTAPAKEPPEPVEAPAEDKPRPPAIHSAPAKEQTEPGGA